MNFPLGTGNSLQLLHRKTNTPGWEGLLNGKSVTGGKASSQDLVTPNDLFEDLFSYLFTKGSLQTYWEAQGIGRIPRPKLIQDPESLLPERQGGRLLVLTVTSQDLSQQLLFLRQGET